MVRDVTKKPMVTLAEPQRSRVEMGRNFQKDNHHRITSSIWALWQSGQSSPFGVCKKKHLKNFQTVRNCLMKPRFNCLASIPSIMSGGKQAAPVFYLLYDPNAEAWQWQHDDVGVFFSGRDRVIGHG